MRIVGRDRNEIIGERSGERLAAGVVADLLAEHAAEPLHARAHDLPVQSKWIDHAPDVVDGDKVQDLDLPGRRIDRDMRDGRAIAVGRLRIAKLAVCGETREFGERKLAAVVCY